MAPKDHTLEGAWREIERLRDDLIKLRTVARGKPRVQMGSFTCPNVDGTEKVVTGVGFHPRAVQFFATIANSTSAIHNGWGLAAQTEDGIQQMAHGIRGTTAGPTMARNRATTRCVICPDTGGGSALAATLDSFDPDGYSMTFVTANNGFDIYWIAYG